jgi:hypothetical protein
MVGGEEGEGWEDDGSVGEGRGMARLSGEGV